MSRVELDEDDTAELSAVVLDRGELVKRRKERMKTMYERSQNAGRDLYRCLVCNNPSVKWEHFEEHFDKIVEVDAEMRREVLARREANHEVEDPVRWEEHYRTNCKLRRPG